MASKPKILVVEDELVVAQDLKSSLECMGYSVCATVDTGVEAIKKAEECGPDLILMDIMLQEDMDGIEAAQRIRSRFDVPIIFLTAFADKNILERAKVTDPFGYMIKPFEDEALRSTMEVTLLKHKMEVDLRRAKEAAEASTKLKDNFVTLVAHDLRSPLANIIGFLKIIHDDQIAPPSLEHRKILQIVLESSGRMLDMIQEILKIGGLQTGKIVPKRKFLNGHNVADIIVQQLYHSANEKEIDLKNKVPENTRIYADPCLFHEVLMNMVSNSIKFARKGDQVTIFAPPRQGTTIAVRDTGVGINEFLLPDLFKHEIKTTTVGTKGEKGTGFGLPLCFDIIKAHDGALTVESTQGKGTVFYASLPAIQPMLLMVEDSLITRRELKKILKPEDIEIEEAENGEKALAKMENQKPHLILLDLLMPVMDGFEMLKQLKNDERFKEIPVIVITGHDSRENREKAFKLGADDIITKPTSAEEMIPRIGKFIYGY